MGLGELIVIALLALLLVGPERLPDTIRSVSKWLFALKHQFQSVKREVENELGLDEIRRDVHNSQIMKDLQTMEQQLQDEHIAMDDSGASESNAGVIADSKDSDYPPSNDVNS